MLEDYDVKDAEAFDDVADDISIFLEDIKDRLSVSAYFGVTSSVVASKDQLSVNQDENARLVFKKREP